MDLVAGIDSSTQSVKVVIRNAQSGEFIREGRAPHPAGSEVDPLKWQLALEEAVVNAGGIEDVVALSIAGQQHGMVALDEEGRVIRPALLWNDVRSAQAAEDLNQELGGNQATAKKVGSVLLASFTASKLRWLADWEPANAAKIAAVALPHDWLSWQLNESRELSALFTDRSDASGTGYFDSTSNTYCHDILEIALRRSDAISLPQVIAPHLFGGRSKSGIPIAAGAGDNAAAALGVHAEPGDIVISLGTSGTAFALSNSPTHDSAGLVAGFADATGKFLPLVCTLNAARILDAATTILNRTHDEVGKLALSATAGSEGLVLLPYFEGERTPNRPAASGVLAGMTLANSTPGNIARAMIEGMLCGLVDGVAALESAGVVVNRILLIGGAAKNPGIAPIASALFGREVLLPPAGEYVANGAARQAAWAHFGESEAPHWDLGKVLTVEADPTPGVIEKYRELRDRTQTW